MQIKPSIKINSQLVLVFLRLSFVLCASEFSSKVSEQIIVGRRLNQEAEEEEDEDQGNRVITIDDLSLPSIKNLTSSYGLSSSRERQSKRPTSTTARPSLARFKFPPLGEDSIGSQGDSFGRPASDGRHDDAAQLAPSIVLPPAELEAGNAEPQIEGKQR